MDANDLAGEPRAQRGEETDTDYVSAGTEFLLPVDAILIAGSVSDSQSCAVDVHTH